MPVYATLYLQVDNKLFSEKLYVDDVREGNATYWDSLMEFTLSNKEGTRIELRYSHNKYKNLSQAFHF